MGALRLLILVSFAIFVGEIGIMFSLEHYPIESVILRATVDAVALTVMVFPFLYFLVFKTLLRTTKDLAAAREQLLRDQAKLEERIEQRANEVTVANNALQKTVQQLRERQNEMVRLAEMMSYFHACRNLNEGLDIAKSWLQRLFPQTLGTLFLMNASRNMMEPAVTWGQLAEMQHHAPGDCWALRRAKSHESFGSEHAVPCRHLELMKDGSYICLPLTGQGQALGTLCIQAEQVLGDKAREKRGIRMDFCVTVAERLSLAITNLRLRDTLRFQALRDPLTGLFNRRYLLDTLDRELERAVSQEKALSIVMLDVDHFKKFNDAFGHAAGDAVLGRLGNLFREWARGEDIVARYGGEEFTIVLPDTPPADALERIEILRQRIEELAIEHHGQSLTRVTISAGIAAYPIHGMDRATLINLADQALYSAKKSGRNRATVAPQTAGLTHTLAIAAQFDLSPNPGARGDPEYLPSRMNLSTLCQHATPTTTVSDRSFPPLTQVV